MPRSHPYITNLTPLRGVAASWVAIYHFKNFAVAFKNFDHTRILAKGYLMVDLFFIMSGFIMVHVYGNYFSDSIKANNFRKFIVARIARIYPLHVFTLLIIMLIAISSRQFDELNDLGAIPANLFLLHSFNTTSGVTWNLPSWSISAEWGAYLFSHFWHFSFIERSRWRSFCYQFWHWVYTCQSCFGCLGSEHGHHYFQRTIWMLITILAG